MNGVVSRSFRSGVRDYHKSKPVRSRDHKPINTTNNYSNFRNNKTFYNNVHGWETNNYRYVSGSGGDCYNRFDFQHRQRLRTGDRFVEIHEEERFQGFDPMGGILENTRSTTVHVVQPCGVTCSYQKITKTVGVTHQVTMQRSVEMVSDIGRPIVFVETAFVRCINVTYRQF